MRINEITPVFVNRIPSEIEEGILYIAIECDAIIHKCACGCGKIISTPTDENGWSLTYKDSYVSLSPSIGNFNYKCKSHYFITQNKIIWLPQEAKTKHKIHKKKWWNRFFRIN